MTNESAYRMVGTELIYTAQQMIELLLKGYVILDQNNEPRENTEYELPNNATLDLAEDVFNQLEGHDRVFLNCLRALRILYFLELNNTPEKVKYRSTAIQMLQKEDKTKLPLVRFIYLSDIIPIHILEESLLKQLGINGLYKQEKEKDSDELKLSANGKKELKALLDNIKVLEDNVEKATKFDQTDAYYYLNDLRQYGNMMCKWKENNENCLIKTEVIHTILNKLPKQFPAQSK